jgi:hypothetical protein
MPIANVDELLAQGEQERRNARVCSPKQLVKLNKTKTPKAVEDKHLFKKGTIFTNLRS